MGCTMTEKHCVVIGAGIGGLTTAALLLQAGLRVTVLEAHIYPGGSAGTFYNRGYRFDAGATLAGGFTTGGPHARLGEKLGLRWPISPVDPAWVTHLPDLSVAQWSSHERWQQERQSAFPSMEKFWQRQEMLAGAAWDVSSRPFPWPPESPADALTLARAVRAGTLLAAPYLFSSVGRLIPSSAPASFRAFLDAQLLISAQCTADQASALYGSAALDLPRRGVFNVQGGIGGLALALARWIRENGGEVVYRQAVKQILLKNGRAAAVRTKKGLEIACDYLVANLTPWSLHSLLAEAAPVSLHRDVASRQPTWGAFTLYLGLEDSRLPAGVPDHHQVVTDLTQPLGEGNSIFLSISPHQDGSRAPAGMRAATISTHTRVADWWALANHDPQAYAARREAYTEKVLRAAEWAVPGLRAAVQLCLPGTPVTFQFYTRREMGMVGGFPQTWVVSARGPATGIPNLWLVGDSIFPGQSTAGTTLGGWRVAAAVQRAAGR
jgi:C-3',4' desaturase CrtD